VSRQFYIDSVIPLLNITFPSNNQYFTIQPTLNFTATDANRDKCWYTINGGASSTPDATCANITSQIWSQGRNNVVLYVNDSAHNQVSRSISFSVDTLAPTITITHPASNNLWYNYQTKVNYTATDPNLNFCWWGNGTVNSTPALCGVNICQQNSANVSTACGGLSTGSYKIGRAHV
jgi:hypothetical protein